MGQHPPGNVVLLLRRLSEVGLRHGQRALGQARPFQDGGRITEAEGVTRPHTAVIVFFELLPQRQAGGALDRIPGSSAGHTRSCRFLRRLQRLIIQRQHRGELRLQIGIDLDLLGRERPPVPGESPLHLHIQVIDRIVELLRGVPVVLDELAHHVRVSQQAPECVGYRFFRKVRLGPVKVLLHGGIQGEALVAHVPHDEIPHRLIGARRQVPNAVDGLMHGGGENGILRIERDGDHAVFILGIRRAALHIPVCVGHIEVVHEADLRSEHLSERVKRPLLLPRQPGLPEHIVIHQAGGVGNIARPRQREVFRRLHPGGGFFVSGVHRLRSRQLQCLDRFLGLQPLLRLLGDGLRQLLRAHALDRFDRQLHGHAGEGADQGAVPGILADLAEAPLVVADQPLVEAPVREFGNELLSTLAQRIRQEEDRPLRRFAADVLLDQVLNGVIQGPNTEAGNTAEHLLREDLHSGHSAAVDHGEFILHPGRQGLLCGVSCRLGGHDPEARPRQDKIAEDRRHHAADAVGGVGKGP